MPKFINSITLEDFRSFSQKEIDLGDIVCLVGANESGKTNLLDAISLAKVGNIDDVNDKQVLRESDTRKNSKRSFKRELPTIKYALSVDIITNGVAKRILNASNIDSMVLVRTGNELKVEIPPTPAGIKLIKNVSNEPIQMTVSPTPSEPPMTAAEKKKHKVKDVPPQNLDPNSFTFLTKEMEENYKESIEELTQSGQLQILESVGADQLLANYLLKEIKN